MKPRYLDRPAVAGTRARGTLVLLHAFPLNARMWDPQMTMAEHGWRVVAPQFRQFDNGAGEPAAQSVDDYAGDVIDLLDALKVEEAVVAGLSLGGYVAFAILRLASRYVQGLVLADTRSQADTPEGIEGRKRMLSLVAERGTAPIVDEMIPKLLGETTRNTRPAVVDEVRALGLTSPPSAVAGAIRALMTRPDSAQLLPSIHCPTLVVVGAEDTITPPALSEELHQAIGGSELAVVPAAGHLSNLERPDVFNDALVRFLTHRV